MTEHKDLKRKKRVAIGNEFMKMLFEHPDNYYVENSLPEGTNFVRMYQDPARDCTYAVFQNDNWEALDEAECIPIMSIEFRKIQCRECNTKMMFDEEAHEQYCPRCERRFYP